MVFAHYYYRINLFKHALKVICDYKYDSRHEPNNYKWLTLEMGVWRSLLTILMSLNGFVDGNAVCDEDANTEDVFRQQINLIKSRGTCPEGITLDFHSSLSGLHSSLYEHRRRHALISHSSLSELWFTKWNFTSFTLRKNFVPIYLLLYKTIQ